MTDPNKDEDMAEVLLQSLRPLVRLLLTGGVNHRKFSQVCKVAFVQVAAQEYGLRGRPTNTSRVAAMTGLTRKEVKKIREAGLEQVIDATPRISSPADVLHSWYTNPRYLTRDGYPRELPYADGDSSFVNLVRESGVDIPPGAVKSELKRVGAVAELPDGRLQVRQRHFLPSGLEDLILEGLYFGIRTLASTVSHNAATAFDPSSERRFQRVVEVRVPNNYSASEIKKEVESRLSDLSIELDDALSKVSERAHKKENADGLKKSVGVGLYYFEEG